MGIANPGFAHERHALDAVLTLSPGHYVLELPFDVPALMLSRAVNHAHPERSAPDLLALTAEERARAFAQAERFIRINLRIDIDGERANPEIRLPSYEPGELGQLGGEGNQFFIRLEGPLPPGAETMTVTPGRALGQLNLEAVSATGIRLPPQVIPGGVAGRSVSLLPPPPPPSRAEVFVEYLAAGFRGSVSNGVELLLLLMGILLLSSRWRTLWGQFAAFALGLALALALAAPGHLSVPSSIVRILMAVSIVIVAVEDATGDRLRVWRPALVFLLGLPHGLGLAAIYAGGFTALPHPVLSLVGLGVGLGVAMLLVLIPGWAMLYQAERRPEYGKRLRRPLLIALALGGFILMIQRLQDLAI